MGLGLSEISQILKFSSFFLENVVKVLNPQIDEIQFVMTLICILIFGKVSSCILLVFHLFYAITFKKSKEKTARKKTCVEERNKTSMEPDTRAISRERRALPIPDFV